MTYPNHGAAPATLEQVADALVEHLLESMPPGGVYGKVALARLPGPVEHVLTAALERKVARETAPPATEWIDADDPDVRDAARRWREAAQEAARYPPDAWSAALSDGARQALRHLVEPAEAVALFCFAGETGPLPVATVRARMSAFGPYPYLREIAERYAERKGLEQIDRSGLTSLLRRIDRRMTSGYGAGEWDALLAPLYALVGPLPGLSGRLPADVLKRFFAARGADELANAVTRQAAWAPEELHDAVAAIAGGAAAVPVTAVTDAVEEEGESTLPWAALPGTGVGRPGDEAPEEDPSAIVSSSAAIQDQQVAEHARDDDATVDMDRALAQHFGLEADPSNTPSTEPPTLPPPPAPTRDGADEALWKTFAAERPPAATPFAEVDPPDAEPLWQRLARTHGDAPAAGAGAPAHEPLAHLEARVLGQEALSQRDWFVANVAGGSEAEYRRLLEELDSAPTWADAWPVLARAFKAHAVDIYSEPAVALTDAAEARFGG